MATIAVAACGGGGSSPAPVTAAGAPGAIVPTASSTSQPSSAKTANATITIQWPATSTAASAHREYLSGSTQSVAIVISTGGVAFSTTFVNNPALSGSPNQTTVTSLAAPIGADTFAVTSYDAKNGSGNLLGGATVPFTIVADAANTIPVTLNGNLGKIACAPVGPIVSGSNNAYTMVGPAGQFALLPEDLDGNIIVAPGAIPSLTLTAANTSQATVAATSTPNLFTIDLSVTNTAVGFSGTGTNLGAATVKSPTCTVTRVPALYVTNYGTEATKESVTIYPASAASGDATPTATIAGTSTLQSAIQFVAVDPKGDVFVTNQGPMPGATYGPTSGYIAVYPPGASGNTAPIATIPGFNRPEGIAFDSSGNLYVLDLTRIIEYPANADGATAPAVASNVISGSNTMLITCYGLTVANGLIYASCDPYPFYISTWPVGTNGNVAPTFFESPGGTAMSYNEISWLSIAADSAGNIYAPDANNNMNEIYEYAAGTSGTGASPEDLITGAGFSQPVGIFIDSTGAFYVANYGLTNVSEVGGAGSPSVQTFSSTTVLKTGVATNTLSGADTGLNGPYGVYVR